MEEIQRMANHLFITIQGMLYSRPFCVVLFIISQEWYHKATSVHLFSSAHILTRAMKFGLLIDNAPSLQLKYILLRKKLVTTLQIMLF